MNLKVLFVAFLCLSSLSIIFNVAMVTLNTPQASSLKAFAHIVHEGFHRINGTELMGDPSGGGWP